MPRSAMMVAASATTAISRTAVTTVFFGTDFSALSALFLNCILKPTGTLSHTEKLLDVSKTIMEGNGVVLEMLRPADYELAPGVYPDMREHGFARDDWPDICGKVMAADILVIGTPIWLGEESSVCRRVIERLYGESSKLNDKGQYVYYGRVGGCIVTGNEDGVELSAMTMLYALQHVGYTIPPQADAGWIGEAGRGRPAPTRAPAIRRTISPSAVRPS